MVVVVVVVVTEDGLAAVAVLVGTVFGAVGNDGDDNAWVTGGVVGGVACGDESRFRRIVLTGSPDAGSLPAIDSGTTCCCCGCGI